jgi:HEAT repeat protein
VATPALEALAADDDAEARARLVPKMYAGGFGETQALAKIGDPGAINRLIELTNQTSGSKSHLINAMVQSRSPLVVPVLMKILNDPNHLPDVAAAADGLGIMGAREAISQLQQLFRDPRSTHDVKFGAAQGLFKMGDRSAVTFLQQQLTSDYAPVRMSAASAMASDPDGTWQTVVRSLTGDQDPSMRVQAAGLIAPYDLELARRTAEELLNDDNIAVRELAGRILVEKIATDFATMRRMMRSSMPLTRVAAAARVLELSR